MAEAFKRGGYWWQEKPDGTWLRWDQAGEKWEVSDQPPPPPSEVEAAGLPPARPITAMATWVKVLLGVGIALDVVAIFSGLAERSLLERIFRGEFVTPSEVDASDARQAAIAGLQLLLFLAVGIAFIIWFHRAYHNLAAYGASGLPYGFGWAIGGWFVPVISLFYPKRIANTIWRASHPDIPVPVGIDWRPKPVTPLLSWWWGIFIISGILYAATGGLAADAITEDEIRVSSTWTLIAEALSIVAGVLALMVVSRITQRQQVRNQQVGATAT
jgi:hypothetical protein